MTAQSLTDIFPGDSEMSRLMRAHDWSSTPLGHPESWPEGLKVPLRMMLTSRFEMWLGWGPDIAFFYNDAYIPTLGTKHPHAIGRPMQQVWPEIFADLEDRVRSVIDDGVATWDEALLLILERHGYPEETYHTFSYSPLCGDTDRIDGLMCVVTEETTRVIGERRLGTLRALSQALAGTLTRPALFAAIDQALAANRRDFPFSLLYLRDRDGVWSGHATTADAAPLLETDWPFDRMGDGIADIPVDAADAPTGDWSIAPIDAALVPIVRAGADGPLGALVLGLNPYLPHDDGIITFAQLLAGQIAGGLANIEVLEAANGRAERLWQRSRDLSLIVDTDGVLKSANPSWTHILGYPVEDVIGRTFFDFVHPDDLAATRVAFARAAAADDLIGFENRYIGLDGTRRCISWNTVTENGLVFAYGRDVTDARAQAAALRTAEAALRQSQKMEAIGQLTGGVAHDFNNLLTVIRSASDLLRLRDLTEEKRKRYIDAISNTADRAAKLTGQLLAFARRQTLKPELFDVGHSVRAIGEMIATLTGPRIRCIYDLGDQPAFVSADPSQFDTALVNLVVNARDAMAGEGTLAIAVRAVASVPAIRTHPIAVGDYVAIRIADTGIGIAASDIYLIFEPFFTTKTVGQGTGLGLSQVFGFTKQSGGEIDVESTPGAGTVFTVYLPRVAAPLAAGVATVEPEPPTDGHGACVLVVEDNADVGAFVTQSLAELGYDSVHAADAVAALVELDTDAARFDVVFSDVVMPGMSGIGLAHEIRRRHPDLPIVLTSGYSDALAQNGSSGFPLLTKPYSVEALSKSLRKAIRSGRDRSA